MVHSAFQSAVWRASLTIAKHVGLFCVARYLTKNALRILCYHGIADADEYKFRGTLFVRSEFFENRLKYLRASRYPILSLGSALTFLDNGSLPSGATVITMDDGWRGVYTRGLRVIQEIGMPVVVYVASYYVEHPIPVYSVTVSFLFWRTNRARVDLPNELGTYQLQEERFAAEDAAQQYGKSLAPDERLRFLKELALVLDVPFDEIDQPKLFHLVTPEQIAQLAHAGIDIQLHTHNHEWSLENEMSNEDEIRANRSFLTPLVSNPLEHFCYPSGVHGPRDGHLLARLGIKTATTIEPGLNYIDTPRHQLCRIIDGERVAEIEFEAEMSGFVEVVRALRRKQLFVFFRRRFFNRKVSSSQTILT